MVKSKILLIDMYGVIIEESKGKFIPYTFRYFEQAEHDRLTKAFREEQYFTKAGNGEITSHEFLTYLGYEKPWETMVDYLENYLTLDVQFLSFAKKWKDKLDIVLLSNDVWEWSEYLTEYHGMNPYFKDKIVSGEVHMRKPQEEIFVYTLNRLGCEGKDCIFVDNSVSNLRAAEKLGIRTVLFNRDNEEFDGTIVNSFEELSAVLEGSEKSKKTDDFFERMLEFFPTVQEEYKRHIEEYNERLDTCIMENIFMPEVMELLRKESDAELLRGIFGYFEEVSNCEDAYLLNIFSITALEILGNDRALLEVARKYMGPKTRELQIEADRDLGRII
ncbi:MAG: HAD-IA family hydrolase [Lachnospiraceae bacterium]|nr:HAD-IA family hydrolase [Lachnospiraceae bacterium]